MQLTGRQLGEMFDRSDRWGRDRIAEVRAQHRLEEAGNSTKSGERQQDAETRRWKPDVPPVSADERGIAAADSVPALPAGSARPAPAPGTTAVSGEPGLATETGNAVRAVPTARPVARSSPEPGRAPAPATMPDAGTRQTTNTTLPGVSGAIRRTTVVAVTVVAAVAAVVSFAHMHDLAVKAGEGWRAWLLPLAVDGLIIAASMTMLVRRRQGQSGGMLAWCSLILGIAASLAANVAAAAPTWEGRIVAAWPPIALLLAYELLMQQVRDTRKR
jgi:hypothetical protein